MPFLMPMTGIGSVASIDPLEARQKQEDRLKMQQMQGIMFVPPRQQDFMQKPKGLMVLTQKKRGRPPEKEKKPPAPTIWRGPVNVGIGDSGD